MLNSILRYFDLQSERRQLQARGQSAGSVHAPVLPQYLTVSAGVVLEPLIRGYIASGAWQYELSAVGGRVLFGLLVGIIILPAVYKSSFDPGTPIGVQLAALFPLGIGWQSLFATATKLTVG